EEYLVWVKEQMDPCYQIKFKQAIINFRKAIRENKKCYKKNLFFSMVCMTLSNLSFIEVADEVQLLKLDPIIQDIVERNLVKPEVVVEYERIRARLRKENFVSLIANLGTTCRSLGGEFELSAQL
ncbi:11900_t:CDS:2, partial [Gigaspora rosea]